jgi:hemoglobin-like flavoprotein
MIPADKCHSLNSTSEKIQHIEPPPQEIPPSTAQIDIVRYTWERLSEIRLPDDDPNVSSTHAFGLAFYDALFELDPSLRSLFPNIFQQARALAGMVSFIARMPSVTGVQLCRSSSLQSDSSNMTIREINAQKRKECQANDFRELVTSALLDTSSDQEETSEWLLYKFRELGARHHFYSVKPHQLDLIGPAILQAIQTRLGKEFLPEVAEAWQVVK